MTRSIDSETPRKQKAPGAGTRGKNQITAE